MGIRAYVTSEGLLAPTQEAAGRGSEKVDIPYEKGPQLEFINGLLTKARLRGAQEVRNRLPAPTPQPQKGMSAEHVLADLDARPGVDVDQVCEVILASSGHTLGRFARSVAMAFGRRAEEEGA